MLQVYWGGQLIDTIDPTSTTMTTNTYTVVGGAGDGTDKLRFTEIGSDDFGGTPIDNVQMFAVLGDTLDGGAGTDTASYAGSDAGVTVDLGAGTASGGDARGDVLSGIENLTGSDSDDVFTGSASINVLTGGGGADTLQGLGGNDTLIGGDGSDSFVIGEGDGNDTVSGGAGGGWTDAIVLQNADSSSVGSGWTVDLTTGSVTADNGSSMTLTDDAAGTITLEDGSEITFDGIERIDY